MNKLFGLSLLALAFLAPVPADAAARFAVCTTTCTWDNTSTAMWSTTSGGATGASAPVAGDDVTLDAATCVGGTTCTITTGAVTISAGSITWGTCTASTTGCIIAANTNNTNFTLNSTAGTVFNGSGTGTRKWTAGTGTYSLTTNTVNGCVNHSTSTNDQGSTYNSATWTCSVTAVNVYNSFNAAGFSFGPTTFNGNSSFGQNFLNGAMTFASMTVNSPNWVTFGNNQTITGALTLNGSSAASPIMLTGSNPDNVATISLGAASTGTWIGIRTITTSGASKLDATNCINYGRVTLANSGTCTAPATGGGGGGRIIGG